MILNIIIHKEKGEDDYIAFFLLLYVKKKKLRVIVKYINVIRDRQTIIIRSQ